MQYQRHFDQLGDATFEGVNTLLEEEKVILAVQLYCMTHDIWYSIRRHSLYPEHQFIKVYGEENVYSVTKWLDLSGWDRF